MTDNTKEQVEQPAEQPPAIEPKAVKALRTALQWAAWRIRQRNRAGRPPL